MGSLIKNVVFDLGGVLIDLDYQRALRSFEEIGVTDAAQLLDPYEQKDFFLALEDGRLDAEAYCQKLCEHTGKQLTYEDVQYAWMGFVTGVQQFKLDYLATLRHEGYKVYLLSNTNPFILTWARTGAFSPAGRPLTDYLDQIFASYEMGVTKPNAEIFRLMVEATGMKPEETLFVDDGKRNVESGKQLGFQTYLPQNGEDWRPALDKILCR